MSQSLADIEEGALRLPDEERARLAVVLLASLEEEVQSPEELEKMWLAEAERRFRELKDGDVQGIPAREVSLGFGLSSPLDANQIPPRCPVRT